MAIQWFDNLKFPAPKDEPLLLWGMADPETDPYAHNNPVHSMLVGYWDADSETWEPLYGPMEGLSMVFSHWAYRPNGPHD